MAIFGDLGSNFLKISVRFEISNFEIAYKKQNFVKIKRLLYFLVQNS